MSATYFEKLQDPRWQKKRLDAMQAADFACSCCGDKSKTLHVHHRQYFKGREPWDYEVSQLEVLCKDCHAITHTEEDQLKLACSYAPSTGEKNKDMIASMIYGVLGMPMDNAPDPYSYLAGELISAILWENEHGFNVYLDVVDLAKKNPKAIWAALSKATKEAKNA